MDDYNAKNSFPSAIIINTHNNNMGRYYHGDINGKFWFGVQSSDDASFFGGESCEPNYVEYYFSSDDLQRIQAGINICKFKLGEHRILLEEYFKTHDCYDDETLAKTLKIGIDKLTDVLTWYARFELGEKIRKCVEKQGHCIFEAEL